MAEYILPVLWPLRLFFLTLKYSNNLLGKYSKNYVAHIKNLMDHSEALAYQI